MNCRNYLESSDEIVAGMFSIYQNTVRLPTREKDSAKLVIDYNAVLLNNGQALLK